MSPLPMQMTTHWWQRPGRLPGRELYHWHMLFHDQPKVHELVAAAQGKAGRPVWPGHDRHALVAHDHLHRRIRR
jgi:hypothetical protein